MRMCSVKKYAIKLFVTLNQNEQEKSWFDDWFDVVWKMKNFLYRYQTIG